LWVSVCSKRYRRNWNHGPRLLESTRRQVVRGVLREKITCGLPPPLRNDGHPSQELHLGLRQPPAPVGYTRLGPTSSLVFLRLGGPQKAMSSSIQALR